MGCHVVYGKPLSIAAITGFAGPVIRLADVVRKRSSGVDRTALPPAMAPRISDLDHAARSHGPPSRGLLASERVCVPLDSDCPVHDRPCIRMAIADDVGVVVIGRNEGERLVNCLNTVKASASRVIYVDSGSTDESVEFATRIGIYAVRLDPNLPFTAARARNEGFLALKSLHPDIRFVQFIDGDCILVSGWLEAARAFLTDRKDVAIVCGRRRERHPDGSLYNRLCDMEWDTPVGEAAASGGDALVRSEAFEAAGRFRTTLIAGEEPELCLRLRVQGWKIWRLDTEMTLHDAAMTRFGQWWARAVRCGYGYADVVWLHRNSPQGIWRRETLRALIWGGLLPAAIGIGALGHPAALLGALLYPVQICRLALKDGALSGFAWERAALVTVGKFAEFQGILRLLWHKARRHAATLIEYK